MTRYTFDPDKRIIEEHPGGIYVLQQEAEEAVNKAGSEFRDRCLEAEGKVEELEHRLAQLEPFVAGIWFDELPPEKKVALMKEAKLREAAGL